MNRNVSMGISVLFHPVVVNTCSFYFFIRLHPVLSLSLPPQAVWFYLMFYLVAAVCIPVVSVLVLKGFGMVRSVLLEQAEERRVPYIITAVLLLFTHFIFKNLNVPAPLQLFVLLHALIAVILLLVTPFEKLSIHMASLGMMLGLLFRMAPYTDTRLFIAALLLITGLTASARLFAGAHTYRQLILGFASGFVSTLLLI